MIWVCGTLLMPYSLPIWFWPQIITMGVIVGCCFAPSWGTFTALRALQGLFGTVPQVIGLPIIHDMYHPKGRFNLRYLMVCLLTCRQTGPE